MVKVCLFDAELGHPDPLQGLEGKPEEGTAEEVPQGRQVRDGRVVRVHPSLPHPEYHYPAHVEQERHLQPGRHQVEDQEGRGRRSVTGLEIADQVDEQGVPRQDQGQQDARGH